MNNHGSAPSPCYLSLERRSAPNYASISSHDHRLKLAQVTFRFCLPKRCNNKPVKLRHLLPLLTPLMPLSVAMAVVYTASHRLTTLKKTVKEAAATLKRTQFICF